MAIEIAPPEPDLDRLNLDQPNVDHLDIAAVRKRRRNTRMLWRLSGWGGSAAIALTALAITTQTQSGSERLQLAFAPENQPARAVSMAEVTPRAVENDAATRALEAQVLALAADRDRLSARIASLEHNLDDMTGSINRQAAAAAAAKSPAQAPAPNIAASVSAPAAVSIAAAPSPPATASAPQVMPALERLAPLAMPAASAAAASWPDAASTPAAPPAPEAVPLPPTRLAAAPSNEATAPPAHKPEIGVDLGGAPNMEVLGARWAAVKANFGPLLTGLYPLAAHVRRPDATDFRLLVGPLPNAAAAAQLCLRLAAARVTCRPAKFAGERIAQR